MPRSFRVTFQIALALMASLALGACGDAGNGDGGGGPPTKADVVSHLEGLLAAIEAKDWDGAGAHMLLNENAPPKEKWPDVFAGMVSKKEISKAGIAILAEKGKFGPLKEIFEGRGESWAKRAGVPVEECYALAHDGAEVAVIRGAGGLKLIRLDDVGKLR
ncbi:MAG: hypothetical protein QNJ98_04230 [Planctomycetota bacterium]|nr:hypothetical protein [Planctomycetota bacterium]